MKERSMHIFNFNY